MKRTWITALALGGLLLASLSAAPPGRPQAQNIIFVCGNEPASQDKVVSLKEAAAKAKARGIVINPIYCGGARDADARDWVEFARLCGGRFSNIDQDKGVAVIETPMDKK